MVGTEIVADDGCELEDDEDACREDTADVQHDADTVERKVSNPVAEVWEGISGRRGRGTPALRLQN